MKEVLVTARVSKNLKGTAQKVLKHAAIVASATLEVLRTRAECPSDTDVEGQLRRMKEELVKARQEASQAREELNKLRAEIEELKNSKKGNTGGGSKILSDSSDSSPKVHTRELRKRKKKGSPKKEKEKTAEPDSGKVEAPMEIDFPEVPLRESHTTIELLGDDETRRKEILPPREKWPPVIRTVLQGKVRILEDRPLEGHTVRIVDAKDKGKNEVKTIAPKSASKEKKGEAHSIMEQLTLLLNK